MKVWITKYALTSGVFIAEAEATHVPTMISVRTGGLTALYHGNEWHTEEQSAMRRVYDMQQAKIKSLEKALKKVRELTFEPKAVQP